MIIGSLNTKIKEFDPFPEFAKNSNLKFINKIKFIIYEN